MRRFSFLIEPKGRKLKRCLRRLVFIFFGLDGSGIDESPKFDPVLGPILFVAFAALSNTLLTSVLVAILSTTYASIASDAAAEDMFRKAVACFEGVKANSLFDCERCGRACRVAICR